MRIIFMAAPVRALCTKLQLPFPVWKFCQIHPLTKCPPKHDAVSESIPVTNKRNSWSSTSYFFWLLLSGSN